MAEAAPALAGEALRRAEAALGRIRHSPNPSTLWKRAPDAASPSRRKLASAAPAMTSEPMAETLPSRTSTSPARRERTRAPHRRRRLRGPARPPPRTGARQKVDLHKISILALAEQYLAFIEAARRLRLELAADYLVMAAWLAYLKSRLLLPEETKGEEPIGRRPRGRAGPAPAAARGDPRGGEAPRRARPARPRRLRPRRAGAGDGRREPLWEATLYDLLSAYARQRAGAGRDLTSPCRGATSGRSPTRARRWSGSSAGRGLVVLDAFLSATWSSRRCGRPSSPRPSPPPWKWCAKGR